MRRKGFIIAALLVVLGGIGFGVASFSGLFSDAKKMLFPPSPVILIVIDALRADRLGQYGYDLDTSPGLNDLASHSTMFSHCYTNAPWTRPAMATLFTGLHPIRHSVTRQTSLSDNAVTLAESLKLAGMNTVGISLNPNVSKRTGMNQGFDLFEEMFGSSMAAYLNVKEMRRLARMWYRGKSKDSYFLFMLPMNVHGPYKVPRSKREVLLGRKPTRGFSYRKTAMKNVMLSGNAAEARTRVTPKQIRSLQEKYDTAVRYTTDQLGTFFEYLKSKGYYKEALIIVTSDHGEELFEHGGFSHGFTLYNELLHVPLFVKLPFQTQANVVDEQVVLADIYPTIMDLLDLEVPQAIDGESFAHLLEDEAREELSSPSNRGTEVFSVAWPGRCVAQAVIERPWKLIKISSNYEGLENETFLFNVETDPGETENLAGQYPDLVKYLSKKIEKDVASFVGRGTYAKNLVIDSEMKEQLKALGYIQ